MKRGEDADKSAMWSSGLVGEQGGVRAGAASWIVQCKHC